MRLLGGAVAATLLIAACGGDKSNPQATAQAKVTTAQAAVTTAQGELNQAKAQFCSATKDYVGAIDNYGKVFDGSAVTVGDMNTAGADLLNPQADVLTAVDAVSAANDSLAEAQQQLSDAQASLASVQSSSFSAPTTTSTTPGVEPTIIDQVKKAEAEWTAVTDGIGDQTPLVQATADVNSAAVALEMAWLQVLGQSGCLTDAQQQQAAAAVEKYTTSLQTSLQAAGFYSGDIDGIYGPETIQAVSDLQTANQLPATGWVDQATALALATALTAKGGEAAAVAVITTTAVQTTLSLAGYWTGPIDGQWTPALTDALKNFQTALGVPPTGTVDAPTLAALETAIANAKAGSTSTTTSTTPSPASSTSSSSASTASSSSS
jgi:peptidoglycan hydrolase-like protein with peptidoglycan-binding domain